MVCHQRMRESSDEADEGGGEQVVHMEIAPLARGQRSTGAAERRHRENEEVAIEKRDDLEGDSARPAQQKPNMQDTLTYPLTKSRATPPDLAEEVRTIEEGPTQVEEHEQLKGGMYLLTNTVLQGDFDQKGSFSPIEGEDFVPESQDNEFEEGEIKEVFRVEEYDGIYLELGLFLSCEMRDRDASVKTQKMRHLYVVRDDHLFIKRQVGNPKRVVCGRNRQIDIIAALHDGIAGGHRRIGATCAKINELYHWDGMLSMVIKYWQSCVPCQERSAQRPGEPLHPRLEREVGAVVHLDLLFMPIGENGCNYIFDARDNLTVFVDGRAILTKTGPVLTSCIEEYYLRYPFVKEFVMNRGSEFTWNEVQTLLAGYGVVANYTTVAHPQANAPVERGHNRPEPRVDRRRRSKRLRDLEPREPIVTRGGRKALAQREGGRAGPAYTTESFPACGLRQVEFHQVTSSDLQGPSLRSSWQGESGPLEAPFRSLETHLDASQWGAPSVGVGPTDPSGEEPARPEPETEPRGQEELHAGEIIMIEGDTPPRTPVPEQVRQPWPEGVPKPDSQEIPAPPPEATMSPRQEIEARGPEEGWRTESRVVIDSRLAAHASKHPDIEVPIPVEPSSGSAHVKPKRGAQTLGRKVHGLRVERVSDETAEAKSARIQARLAEIHAQRDRMEAAGIAPTPPFDPKTSEQRIDELWARYESRREAARQRSQAAGQASERADEAIEIGELGFSATRRVIERVDRRMRQAATTSFQRYTLLNDELTIRKGEVEQLTAQLTEEKAENKAWRTRLEAKEAEWETRLKEMSAAVERFSATKVVDWTKQSRYGIQGEGIQGLFGQGEAPETSQQGKLNKVFMDPAEVEARREANKGSFEFKAPTELASRQEAPGSASAPMEVPTKEPQPAPAEEEAAEESLTILLEVQEGTLTGAVVPPQSEAQRGESSRLDELVAAMEVDMQPERPQRLETPEHVPEMRELRTQLGSWATGTDSGGLATERQEQGATSQPARAATPQALEPHET
ncbi:hypothetical protein CBR_g5601 [Chara braunii]|uniref:Integrase catalytic domain-containing protein n=1 Tax=Chara braunii TaxID=69332 RepID=A0A388JRK8_CHABU|nr:hypothetical protein CBR_g5601 [Chara braunii]|eukprot:GBG60425.1 hypothetical protein CBR_g5601 [Chara braunii]